MQENQSVVRKTMRTVDFFTIYFANFKAIVLSNLLFSVFTVIAAGYVYFTYKMLGGLSAVVCAAAVIPLNAGMSGVTQVCRYIYTGKKFSVTRTFFDGLKENFLKCLLHGIIFYILFVICYFSIILYYSGTSSNFLFWIPLVITGLVSLFVLFASYYPNIMTITIDIRLKSLYRNCVLFSFGELKNNLLATIALLIFSAVIFAILAIFFHPIAFAVLAVFLSLLIIPSTVQYIITFYVYDGMINILDKSRKDNKPQEDKKSAVVIEQAEADELSQAVHETKDEYIFHNGRMLKRSEVEKKLQDNHFDDDMG